MIYNPDCTLCELHTSARNVCLMSNSNPNKHRVMIIGDHPGYKDDEIGRLFSGRLASYFKELKSYLRVPEKDIYVTNVVKCKPEDDEDPSAAQLKVCTSNYLIQEIERVDPEFIIPLGALALKFFTGNARITEVRGQPLEWKGRHVFPTLHPNAANKRASADQVIRTDFKRFGNFINDGIPVAPNLNFHIIRNFDDFNECVEDCKTSDFTAFDLETSGLQSYNPLERIQALGLDLETKKQWILPVCARDARWRNKPEIQLKMFTILSDMAKKYGLKMNGHNGKFDNLWMMRKFGRFVRFFLNFDTMIASHTLNENRRHSLKELTINELGGPSYDIPLKDKTGQGDLMKMYKYLALDVFYTNHLYLKFKAQLMKDPALLKLFKHVIMPSTRAMEMVEYNGVWVNQQTMHERRTEIMNKVSKLENSMFEIVGKQINWNSPDQVGKVLFDDCKLKPIGFTKKKKPQTGEPILIRLKDEHPIVPLLLDHREYSKKLSGFIEGWKKEIIGGFMYPSYLIHGTITGRYSCKGPNLQQVPRDPEIRSLIDAPYVPEPGWDEDDGWVFFQADYSQLELRIAAMISKDPTMIRIFQSGGDMHTVTAQAVSGTDGSEYKTEFEKKEWRKKAKAVNFGFLYGMGHRKFQDYSKEKYGVAVTEGEARMARKRFFETYKGLVKWHDRQRNIAHSMGQVRNPAGRIRHLPDIYSEDTGQVAEAERGAINSPVQGFGAELMAMTLGEAVPKFDYDNELRIVGTIHDSAVGWVRKSKIHELLPRFRKIMMSPRALRLLEIDIPIPILVDIEVGPWGKARAYEDGSDSYLPRVA